MQFSELKIGDKFTVEDYPELTFTKTNYTGTTCCTQEHNAKYKEGGKKNKSVMLFKDDTIVIKKV